MVEYQIHELAGEMPPMPDKQYQSLLESVTANGVRVPLVLFEDKILDGRHRYRAWQESLGKTLIDHELPISDYSPANYDEAYRYVVDLNIRRRHLTPSQASIAIVKMNEWFENGDNQYTKEGVQNCTPKTSQEMADEVSVSKRNVDSAKKVVSEGSDDLVSAVENDDISVDEAAKLVDKEPEYQERVLEKVSEGKKASVAIKETNVEDSRAKSAKVQSGLKSDDYRLVHSAIADLHNHVDANSVDFIITDPPYPKEDLYCWKDLKDFAIHALKPGGSLVAMSGQMYLPTVMIKMLDSLGRLNYQWMIEWLMLSGSASKIHGKVIGQRHKPVLWYVKGKYEGQMLDVDVVHSDAPEKDAFEWQQNEAGFEYLVEMFVNKSGKPKHEIVICDPFHGTGTTGMAAREIGCAYIGSDSNKEWVVF